MIRPEIKKQEHKPPFLMATVTQANPLRIRLDGDTVALPYTPARLVSSWVPEVGQRVKVSVVGGHYCVDSAIGAGSEIGSNANGHYIKFADGTLICQKQVTATVSVSNEWGALFITASRVSLGSHAAAFTQLHGITVGLTGDFDGFLSTVVGASTTSAGSAHIMRGTANASATYTINVFAIGRWK